MYTSLGEEFFERRPRQYIVSIPTRIHIQRKDGTSYSFRGHYPSTDLSPEIRAMLDQGVAGADEGVRRQAAKDMILAEQAREQDARHGAVREDFSNLVLAEFSDKTFWYDPAGQWEYS